MRGGILRCAEACLGNGNIGTWDIKSSKAECVECFYHGGPLILCKTGGNMPLRLYCLNCASKCDRNDILGDVSRF